MNDNRLLNGSDYLMLGFDHELRRHGFAGNSCQIVLELASAISPEALRQRLGELSRHYALMHARPGGIFRPQWRPLGKTIIPVVRVHPDQPQLAHEIFNEPLAMEQGELLRFDLLTGSDGRTRLIFTWAHALMDAPGAEYFLTLLGYPDQPLSKPESASFSTPKPSLKNRCRLAWKSLHQLDEFCQAPPRSLGIRHAGAPARLHYRTEKFSAAETERIRANSARLCGVLGDAQYHAAASVVELHRLYERLRRFSPSYVVPVPVGLRRKGSLEPLFGNQLGMLMFQFLPLHVDSVGDAVAVLKKQTEQALRAGLLDSGRILSELFRFLPRSLYVAMVKHGLRGEIASFFFGDTGAVNPRLTTFLGVPVTDFAHVAAVVPSPGISVIFYYFRDALRLTVVHSARVLDDTEAAEFAAGLRARLLNS